MGIDLITRALAAGEVMSNLAKNGQIGYTKKQALVIIPDGSYDFNIGEYQAQTIVSAKAGDLITLTLDGVVYSGKAKSILADVEYLYIGNASLLGEEDTGENYVTIFVPSARFVTIALLDEATSGVSATHTVELSVEMDVTRPISAQYLPCVTLSTPCELDDPNGTIMNDADCAKLDELAATGMPAIIRFNLTFQAIVDGGEETRVSTASAWCSYYLFSEQSTFACLVASRTGLIKCTFDNASGGWFFFSQNATVS